MYAAASGTDRVTSVTASAFAAFATTNARRTKEAAYIYDTRVSLAAPAAATPAAEAAQ
jgi:hypothetical protein